MEIRHRVAVVTGGGSGIGRAMVAALAREGAKVLVADRNRETAAETVRLVAAQHGAALAWQVDVTNEGQVQDMLDAALAQLGGLDILCNNAGIGEGQDDLFGEGDGWRRIIDVNLVGVVLGTRLGVRAMRERGGGLIVNTASMGGLLPMPTAPVYAASKAGVVNLTRSLAYLKEQAGIRVCAICPTFIDTPLLWSQGDREMVESLVSPVGGPLSPEVVADGLLELVRDDSRAGAIMRVTHARGIDYARDIRP